jgi:hypothetical protein
VSIASFSFSTAFKKVPGLLSRLLVSPTYQTPSSRGQVVSIW